MKWQINSNITVLHALTGDRVGIKEIDRISAALEILKRRAVRAKFLSKQVHRAIKQVEFPRSEILNSH